MHGEGTAAMPGEGTVDTRGDEPQLCMVRERRLARGEESQLCLVRERRLRVARSRSYTW